MPRLLFFATSALFLHRCQGRGIQHAVAIRVDGRIGRSTGPAVLVDAGTDEALRERVVVAESPGIVDCS